MTEIKAKPSRSELDDVIAPEIKQDRFYDLIMSIAANQPLTNVLEIGSSAGGGSTEAFVRGLAVNPSKPRLFCLEVSKPRFNILRETYRPFNFVSCYNMSSVAIEEFPSAEDVAHFYRSVRSKLQRYELAEVLRWLRQDIDYVNSSGVDSGAIERIKEDHGITTFDLVLIDGSEFTGEVEFEKIYGAKIILLDDVDSFKNFKVRKRLLADPNYRLVIEDRELRNGFSIFRRKDVDLTFLRNQLPIHFFTIVLNGEPFIRYHEQVLSQLPVWWHWHIIEGVALLSHDTSWSVASGGHISTAVHDRGWSNDGTSEYLDDLLRRMPDRVTLYRKPHGEFWDGKLEMVNAPLPNIKEPCLLWQIDSDELWTLEQVMAVYRAFRDNRKRTAARYWCWFFVGSDKVVSTRYNYGQRATEWLRTWRFRPGDFWARHEPPILARKRIFRCRPVDVATIAPFTQDEMESYGAVFQHFAYATEAQVTFKEKYYGYTGAVEQWRKLQQITGPGLLRAYLKWVPDNARFADAQKLHVEPLARMEANSGKWIFSAKPTDRSLTSANINQT